VGKVSGGDPKTEADGRALERSLSEMKRSGSAILVVGAVPHDAYVRVSRQMLGAGGESRRRVLVVPQGERERVGERLRDTGSLDPSYARVLAATADTRNGAAAASGGAATSPTGPPVERVEASPAALGAATTTAIEALEEAAGGLAPAELRVGVDVVPTLLSEHGREAAFGFLHVLANQVRHHDGMGHVRLPRERSAEVVRTLAPLFDALLELRVNGVGLEQRWHLTEEGLVSDWLPVGPPGDG
jgi:hypothetical protein